jgi:hypothetical protein
LISEDNGKEGQEIMAESKKPGFPQFIAEPKSAEEARRQFLEAPLDAVGPSTLAAGLEVAQLLSILPNAFVESQKRELKRLQTTGAENDERILLLQSSIEEGEQLRTFVVGAQLRAKRVVGASSGREDVFHGFVSNPDFSPLVGATVRLKGGKSDRGQTAAKTDEDGYFSIPLRAKTSGKGEAGKLSFSQRLNKMFESRNQPSTTPQEEKKARATAQVEIVKKRQVVHEDPVPVIIDEGSVYREYVVSERDSSRATKVDTSVPKPSADETKGTPKKP